MPILRLAYTTQFLIALIAVFVLWSQVGGQGHLDLMPWSVKLGLGLAAAYGVVRATAASVAGDARVEWTGGALAGAHAGGAGGVRIRLVLRSHESGRRGRGRPAAGDCDLVSAASGAGRHSTSGYNSGEVRERATAGAFGADFGDDNPVAFVKKILEDILQLRRGVGAVQRPLVGQHGASFEGAQAGTQRGIVGVLQEVARHQIEFE